MEKISYFVRLHPHWDIVRQKIASDTGFESFNKAHIYLLNCLEIEVSKMQHLFNQAASLSFEKCKEIPMP